MPTWVDEAQLTVAIAALVVSFISAALVIFTIKQAAKALQSQLATSDVQTVLSIWERLDHHWVRFRAAEGDEERRFEFGQLVSYYEMSCSLFRSNTLSTSAAVSLEEHLDEILPAMRKHESFEALFEQLKSREETFENIHWFCGDRSILHRSSILRIYQDIC